MEAGPYSMGGSGYGPFNFMGQFDTLIVTDAEVVRLPAASRATAVSAYDPFGTSVVSALAE